MTLEMSPHSAHPPPPPRPPFLAPPEWTATPPAAHHHRHQFHAATPCDPLHLRQIVARHLDVATSGLLALGWAKECLDESRGADRWPMWIVAEVLRRLPWMIRVWISSGFHWFRSLHGRHCCECACEASQPLPMCPAHLRSASFVEER